MSSTSKRALGVLVAAAITPALGAPTRGDVLDPSVPRVVHVGAPRGAAPSERLDPRRTGRSTTRLPSTPVEIWRRHVSGNVDVPPLVDAAGNVVVALTIPEIIKLAPDSRELWRARLGSMGTLTSPTLLSDGTIAVVTAAGVAMGFTPAGTVRFATALGVPRRDADTAPLALADGGLLVAAGNAVVQIDADGVIVARAALDERGGERAAGAVLPGPARDGGALVTTVSGNVYRFHPPAAPRKIGSFGGAAPRGAVLADERTLLAVVDGRRLVALDLPTGTTHVRTDGIALDGPPTLAPPEPVTASPAPAGSRGPANLHAAGVALVATQVGVLLGVDGAGNERAHVLLDKPQGSLAGGLGLGGTFVQIDLKPSPPVVVDGDGRVAFVRAGGRAGVVTPEGHVEVAGERICAAPVAVVPAGDRRMLVACHDGGLWMYGE